MILFRASETMSPWDLADVNDMIYFVLTNQAFPILEKEKNRQKKEKNKDKTTDL